MLEHDELDSLLNGNDWDRPLSPLDLDLPTDPDIITLLSSSSPVSRVPLPNPPPNPLIDKFLQSLTNAPIQFIDHPATPRQKSRQESIFYCLHCVVPKLNLLKPNRKDHNLTLPHLDDSALFQQLWEQRPKTLEHLSDDLIGFSESSSFLNNRGEKSFFGIAILLKSLDTTLIYTTS